MTSLTAAALAIHARSDGDGDGDGASQSSPPTSVEDGGNGSEQDLEVASDAGSDGKNASATSRLSVSKDGAVVQHRPVPSTSGSAAPHDDSHTSTLTPAVTDPLTQHWAERMARINHGHASSSGVDIGGTSHAGVPLTGPGGTGVVSSGLHPRLGSLTNPTYAAPLPSPSTGDRDPLLLRSRLVPEERVSELRRRGSRRMGGGKANRRLLEFYEAQNGQIERLLKPMYAHTDDAKEEAENKRLKVKIAVWASIIANFSLAALQLYAAVSSLSLSLFATAADSVFDPFANIVLNWLHRKSQTVSPHKWPIGGARFESIGNIAYAFLMGSVNMVLIVESIRDIAGHKPGETNGLHIPSLAAVGVAFMTKFLLFLYCYSIRSSSSQVQVLWEDHRNDLFINGFGIFTSAAGSKIAWWLDPAGAMLIACAVIISWTRTSYGQFQHLAGMAAPSDFLQLVIYNAMLHDQDIEKIDSCRAYHSGPKYVVEVDIVMPSTTPLWKAHDVSQDLQDKLEELPQVERAFVHVDHEVEHKPEHRKYE